MFIHIITEQYRPDSRNSLFEVNWLLEYAFSDSDFDQFLYIDLMGNIGSKGISYQIKTNQGSDEGCNSIMYYAWSPGLLHVCIYEILMFDFCNVLMSNLFQVILLSFHYTPNLTKHPPL